MNVIFTRSALAVMAVALVAAVTPREPVTPVAWASANMVLPDGPRKGETMDFAVTPYLVEPLNFFADGAPGNKGVFRKSKQIGATTIAIAACGYTAMEEPCDVFLIEPTDASLGDFLGEKFQRVVEASPALKATIWDQASRSGRGSTTYAKRFSGGSILMAIANSTADLRGKTRKKVIRDEAAEYPDDLGGQGSPHDMITGAYETFLDGGDWKDLWISTPILKGDVIDTEFNAGDQRYWHVVCPGCKAKFVFTDDPKHFHYNAEYPFNAYYVCPAPNCGTVIEGHQKNDLVRNAERDGGGWIATAPGPGKFFSWHFDAMSSPFVPWDAIAARLIAINGDSSKQKTYDNLTMGRGYEVRGDAPDHVRLFALREAYDRRRIPPRGLLLVISADVQANAIYAEVLALAPDRQSWVVDALILDGDTEDAERGAFAKLAAVYETEWPDSFGGARRADAFGVDSGFRANTVYNWVRGRPNAFALKGGDGWSRPAISLPSLVDIDFRGKKIKNGATLWTVGTWSLKAQLYSDLRKLRQVEGAEIEPPGACHFGQFLDENYFKQITGEYLKEEKFRGRVRRVWAERGANHFLDCRIYNLALADYLGLSRLTGAEWAQLARLRGMPDELATPDLLAPVSVKLAAAAVEPGSDAAPAPVAKPKQATPRPARRRSSTSSFIN